MDKQKDGKLDDLHSNMLKARITKLEYGVVDSSGTFTPIWVEDIRRIYIEEMRKINMNYRFLSSEDMMLGIVYVNHLLKEM